MTAEVAPHIWTREERLAMAHLERALAAAQRAGLAIIGMDSGLYVYRASDLEAEEQRQRGGERGLYEAQLVLHNERDAAYTLNHHGAYRDSGGW
jgi:sugar phosphate isomerase/epimerase